jgi:restriction system protein
MASNASTDVDKLITFGQMALEQGWYDQAREYFDRALDLAPLNQEAIKGFTRTDEILRHKASPEPAEVHQTEPIGNKVRRWVNTTQEWVRKEWKEYRDRVAERKRLEAEEKAERARRILRRREVQRRMIEEREKRYLARIARLDQLRAMSPRKFEQFTGLLFRRMGYVVKITTASADKGVDLFLEKDGRSAIAQCKKYKGNVGQPVVRDFYGTMIHNKADQGYIVTTGTFSLPAQNWARGKQIHLVDGAELMDWAESLLTSTDEAASKA